MAVARLVKHRLLDPITDVMNQTPGTKSPENAFLISWTSEHYSH